MPLHPEIHTMIKERTWSKDREIELIGKDIWRKRKEKLFNRRNWLIHNVTVAAELVLSKPENITINSHDVAIISNDITVDDR